ncbi:hypothetical protein quinque_007918 [Culex quinquefasciatus]
MAFGDYPAEYNPKVHGPYDPARFYGKPDTPFGQVKLGELGAWFGRRDKNPRAAVGAVIVGGMVFFYTINYGKLKHHRNYKYH